MPRCKPCLGSDIKAVILKEIPSLKDVLGKVADCPGPRSLELCGRGKRQPSAYQEFVGQCMKGKSIKSFAEAPQAIRSCAAEWRERKGKGS